MNVSIKRIGILSAFKVGCLMSTVPMIIIVVVLLLSPIVISSRNTSINITGALIIPVILSGIAVALFAGIVAAIHAIIYNVVAFFAGGLELKVDSQEIEEMLLNSGPAAEKHKRIQQQVEDYSRPPEYSREFQDWNRKGKR